MLRKTKIIWGLMLIPFISLAYPPDGWRGQWNLAPNETYDHTENRIATFGDTVHVAFIKKDTPTGDEIYYKRSTDAGFHWGDEKLISASNSDPVDKGLTIAAAEGELVIIVFVHYDQGEDKYQLRYSKSLNGGNSWSDPDTIYTLRGTYSVSLCNPNPSSAARGDSIFFAFHYKLEGASSHFLRLFSLYYKKGTGWQPNYPPPKQLSCNEDNDHPHYCSAVCPKEDGGTYKVCFAEGRNWVPDNTYKIWFHKVEGILQGNQVNTVVHSSPGTDPYCQGIAIDGSHKNPGNTFDYIHVVWDWHKSNPLSDKVVHERSTDGNDWLDDPYTLGSGRTGSDLHCLRETLEVVTCDGSNIYHIRSTDQGANWPSQEAQLTGSMVATDDPHLATNQTSLHVSCVSKDGNPSQSQTSSYLARDNALYTGSDSATACNSGRHLVRKPWTDDLFLSFMSEFSPDQSGNYDQKWIYSSRSDDGAGSWHPYTQIDQGCYPAISYRSGTGTEYIASAYLSDDNQKILYRSYDPSTQEWSDPFEAYTTNNDLDPPAVTAVEDTVFIVFAENSATESWTKCTWFKWDGTGTINIVNIQPPATADYYHFPSVHRDGNRHLHAVWQEGTDVYYARREWKHQDWDQYRNVSGSSDESGNPHIDVFGDDAYVVWTEATPMYPANTEVYRRIKDLFSGFWGNITQISSSADYASDNPTASSEFVVWSETEQTSPYQYDIAYYSDNFGSGWFWTSNFDSRFSHSAIRPHMFEWAYWLYCAWTEGDDSPYQVIADWEFYSSRGGFGTEWYTVETGNKEASPLLIQREGIKDYGNHKIDFDSKELIYELSLLDPAYDYYLIADSYHEGSSRKEAWFMDKEPVGEFVFKSHTLDTTIVKIPYELYAKDRKVEMSFKNASGPLAAKAGLEVVCVEHKPKDGGGEQCDDTKLQVASKVHIFPNPTKGKITLNFSLAAPSQVKVNLYDLTGRRVMALHNQKCAAGAQTLSTDFPQKLTSGIYFLVFQTEEKCITKKVILQR